MYLLDICTEIHLLDIFGSRERKLLIDFNRDAAVPLLQFTAVLVDTMYFAETHWFVVA